MKWFAGKANSPKVRILLDAILDKIAALTKKRPEMTTGLLQIAESP